ncbi:hypothetical protein [uncultured Roseobacter sp.]|uniref:hypothetical protein n=1 Tax=uncultured Roseobacter sp. TaxID=114847 RepID=UPI00260353D6|nr:hypothetical protein [uncultured Roseobacter sp.]
MVVGAATWFPVYFFPVVRFAASDAWAEAIWVIAVPLLWLLCIVQVFWVYHDPKKHDRMMKARWRAKGREMPSEHLLAERPLRALGMLVFLPFLIRFCYLCILVIWVPMATAAVVNKPISHDFTVSELRDGSRGPDVIEFEGHYWMLNGVPSPPEKIWNTANPGDTIRLSGTGNRWGVFYNKIELVK